MLTTCQVKTLKEFKKFLRGDPGVFTIAGDAGTGKSTLIKEMEEAVQQHNMLMLSLDLPTISEVYKAAPTNFAANIIIGQTIHKAFDIQFMKYKDDVLKPAMPWDIQQRCLYIVDEASMVSKHIYNLIIKRAKEEKAYVVFMGDMNQLFPVKETLSNTFKNHELHKMSTVVRQDTSSELYKTIQQAKDAIYDETITLEANEDVKIVSSEEEFKELLKKEFNDKPSNARVLVYSNDKAKAYRKITGKEAYVYYQDKPIGKHLAGEQRDYTAVPVTTIHKAQVGS